MSTGGSSVWLLTCKLMVVWLELYCSSIRMCVCTVTQQAKQSSTQHSNNDGLILRLHPAQDNSFRQNNKQKRCRFSNDHTHISHIYVLVQKLYVQTKGFKFFPSNFKARNKQTNQKKEKRERASLYDFALKYIQTEAQMAVYMHRR